MEFSRQGFWSGLHFLLQGIFPTQVSNPGLPHCRQIPYQLSHLGSPRILEWMAYPFSRGSSQSRAQTQISYIAGGFFSDSATREACNPLHWKCGVLTIGPFGKSFSSAQFSCSVVSDSLRPHESQHARPPCPSPTPRVHSNSCPSSQ